MRRVARCQGCHERGRHLRRPYFASCNSLKPVAMGFVLHLHLFNRQMVPIANGEILETGGCETRTGAARKTKARRTLDVSRRAQASARKR